MKKLCAALLALLIVISTACAYALPIEKDIRFSYNACASTVGADEIDDKQIESSNDRITYKMDGYNIVFLLDGDSIKSAGITFNDGDEGAFLAACIALMNYLGEPGIEQYGALMLYYGVLRSGRDETFPYSSGADVFELTNGEKYNCKYMFVYMNNDLKTAFE